MGAWGKRAGSDPVFVVPPAPPPPSCPTVIMDFASFVEFNNQPGGSFSVIAGATLSMASTTANTGWNVNGLENVVITGPTTVVHMDSSIITTNYTSATTLTISKSLNILNAAIHVPKTASGGGLILPYFTFSIASLTVQFTDASYAFSGLGGNIAAWSWTFGDGGTSTSQNPSHTYAGHGTNVVTLQTTDNTGKLATCVIAITV